jgi:N-carbamoylputrescine amidase
MKVGIVQQSNTRDKAANIAKSIKGIADCKAHGAELVVLQELHCGIYFCQAEETEMFNLAEPIPGETTQLFSEAAKKNEVVLVTSLFEKRAPGLYHNTSVVLKKTVVSPGNTVKCIFPMTRRITKNFTSPPVIWASSQFLLLSENWVSSCAGINGIRRLLG